MDDESSGISVVDMQIFLHFWYSSLIITDIITGLFVVVGLSCHRSGRSSGADAAVEYGLIDKVLNTRG